MAALPPLNDPAANGPARRFGRRGLLLGGAGIAAAALVGCSAKETDLGEPIDFPRAVERIRYAEEHRSQHGFFGFPDSGAAKALVVLIHGGYWVNGFGADLIADAATDLRGLGFATWNIEYRRTNPYAPSDTLDGGYPNTFRDVADAIDHIPKLPLEQEVPVVLVGHSAGGHLAVWAASRTEQTPGGASSVEIAATYALSGVLDLDRGEREKLGNGAVTLLMGGSAAGFPKRYDLGDPSRLVPAHCPVTAFHAAEDTIVPTNQSTSYVTKNKAAGGSATFVEVPGDHLEMVSPGGPAWKVVREAIVRDVG